MKVHKRQFRIITDEFAGYEVQIRHWYWPFWTQAGLVNTHRTIEAAIEFIAKERERLNFKIREVKRFDCE